MVGGWWRLHSLLPVAVGVWKQAVCPVLSLYLFVCPVVGSCISWVRGGVRQILTTHCNQGLIHLPTGKNHSVRKQN